VTALTVLADIFAFCVIIYGGFAMNYVNGIPLWNTALLPVLYVISGLWGGAELTLGISLAQSGTMSGLPAEEAVRILLPGFVLLIPVYLVSVRYTSSTGRASVRYMVLGKWAPFFWLLAVGAGMLLPAAAVITSVLAGTESTPEALLYTAIFSGLLGDLTTRYLILRCGLYNPLIPSPAGIDVPVGG
jgi:polysulfide reductase chain C